MQKATARNRGLLAKVLQLLVRSARTTGSAAAAAAGISRTSRCGHRTSIVTGRLVRGVLAIEVRILVLVAAVFEAAFKGRG
jgi:hypothetical protein